MKDNKIKVKLIYRNYKEIHTTYHSLLNSPPEGVEYTINKPKKIIKKFFPLYRKYSQSSLFKRVISLVQRTLFEKDSTDSKYDILHYIQIKPNKIPTTPFIIDVEQVSALNNFLKFTNKDKAQLFEVFSHDGCIGISTLSKAAAKSIELLFGEQKYNKIKHKVKVIYPAIPVHLKTTNPSKDSRYIDQTTNLKILFVGNNPANKGLFELLTALKELLADHPKISTYIISNTTPQIEVEFSLPNVKYFKPQFENKELIEQFFAHSDIFILPTRGDTFGMVFLEALASQVPVITIKQYATPEIIRNGENGYLLNAKYNYMNKYPIPTKEISQKYKTKGIDSILVKELKETIIYLYNNRQKLEQMKKACFLDFRVGGKFTIEERNKRLLSIYHTAIK